jgi:hypothetical protein
MDQLPENTQDMLAAVAAGRVRQIGGVHTLDGERIPARQIVPLVYNGLAGYTFPPVRCISNAYITESGREALNA